MNGNDQFFLQQNMNLLCRDESCSVYQMKNDTGDGTATFYEIYPGIGVPCSTIPFWRIYELGIRTQPMNRF